MIDNLGAAAADRTVDGPLVIELEKIGVVAVIAAVGLIVANAFAGIFDHFAILRHRFFRVDAVAVDLRAADRETETGIARVNSWGCNGRGHFIYYAGRITSRVA
jgi:hypothetical protein